MLAPDLAFRLRESSAQKRLHLQQRENRGGGNHSLRLLGHSIDGEGLIGKAELGLILQGRDVLQTVVIIARTADVLVGHPGLGIPVRHQHDLLGVGEGQWPQ